MTKEIRSCKLINKRDWEVFLKRGAGKEAVLEQTLNEVWGRCVAGCWEVLSLEAGRCSAAVGTVLSWPSASGAAESGVVSGPDLGGLNRPW